MKQFMWMIDNILVLMAIAVGFFIGLAGLLLAELIGMGGWLMALILVVGGAVTFAFLIGIDSVFDRIFTSGIKKAATKLGADAATAEGFEIDNSKQGRYGLIGFVAGVVIAFAVSFFAPPEQIMGYF
ncbi:MAG: hypothetical protein HKN18_14825 [Silicimonas sp.]|nr:hypothetical protein [Silicimonas sp.]